MVRIKFFLNLSFFCSIGLFLSLTIAKADRFSECKIKVDGTISTINRTAASCMRTCEDYYLSPNNFKYNRSSGFICQNSDGEHVGGALGNPAVLSEALELKDPSYTRVDLRYRVGRKGETLTLKNYLYLERNIMSEFSRETRRSSFVDSVKGVNGKYYSLLNKVLGHFCIENGVDKFCSITSDSLITICGSGASGKNNGYILCRPTPDFPLFIVNINKNGHSQTFAVEGTTESVKTIYRINSESMLSSAFEVVHNDQRVSSYRLPPYFGRSFSTFGRDLPPPAIIKSVNGKKVLQVNSVSKHESGERRGTMFTENPWMAEIKDDIIHLKNGDLESPSTDHEIQYMLDYDGRNFTLISLGETAATVRDQSFSRVLSLMKSEVDLANPIKFKGSTYYEITGPSGAKWLNKNIGAERSCLSSRDDRCLGHLFQFGRDSDGHELRNSALADIIDTNKDGNFIVSDHEVRANDQTVNLFNGDWPIEGNKSSDPFLIERATKWRSLSNSGVCPAGYRVPTSGEFKKAFLIDDNGPAYVKESYDRIFSSSNLRLPEAGVRGKSSINSRGGGYWSSSARASDLSWANKSGGEKKYRYTRSERENYLRISTNFRPRMTYASPYKGLSVRCIKGGVAQGDSSATISEVSSDKITRSQYYITYSDMCKEGSESNDEHLNFVCNGKSTPESTTDLALNTQQQGNTSDITSANTNDGNVRNVASNDNQNNVVGTSSSSDSRSSQGDGILERAKNAFNKIDDPSSLTGEEFAKIVQDVVTPPSVNSSTYPAGYKEALSAFGEETLNKYIDDNGGLNNIKGSLAMFKSISESTSPNYSNKDAIKLLTQAKALYTEEQIYNWFINERRTIKDALEENKISGL